MMLGLAAEADQMRSSPAVKTTKAEAEGARELHSKTPMNESEA